MKIKTLLSITLLCALLLSCDYAVRLVDSPKGEIDRELIGLWEGKGDHWDHSKTIILLAHRLTTAKECDNIILIDKGEIIDQGAYKKLFEENPQFRSMARGIDI